MESAFARQLAVYTQNDFSCRGLPRITPREYETPTQALTRLREMTQCELGFVVRDPVSRELYFASQEEGKQWNLVTMFDDSDPEQVANAYIDKTLHNKGQTTMIVPKRYFPHFGGEVLPITSTLPDAVHASDDIEHVPL